MRTLPLNKNIVTLFPETNQEEVDIPMDLATSAVSLPAGPGWLFLAWKQAHYILSENSHDAVVITAEDETGCGAAGRGFATPGSCPTSTKPGVCRRQ